METLQSRVAFVSGAGSGIGLSIAKALARAGARTVLADINEEAARDAAAAIVSAGGDATGLLLDVASEQSWQQARQHAENLFGPVDILCNNAGVGPARKPLEALSDRDWTFILDVNLRGAANGIRTFLPSMRERGTPCHIVNTGSILSHFATDNSADYIATKYAILGLSESLRLELRPTPVGVSVLCPGLVDSPLAENTVRLSGRVAQDAPAFRNKPKGLDSERVGEAVVEAIRTRRFYIFTHPEYGTFVNRRADEIREAFASSPQLGPADDTSFLARGFAAGE